MVRISGSAWRLNPPGRVPRSTGHRHLLQADNMARLDQSRAARKEPCSKPVCPSRRDGFTIIEATFALMFIGVILAIAIPRLRTDHLKVDAGTRTAMLVLLGAQRTAVHKQHDVVVAFDTTSLLLRVHHDADNDGTMDAGENVSTIQLEGVLFGRGAAPARPMGGAAVTYTRTQAGLPAVTFQRGGSAGEFGGLYLRPGVGVARAEDVRAIEIERSTGRASRLLYAGGQWTRGF